MSTEERVLQPPAGIDREVGLLFAQLEEARRRTRDAVLGMSTHSLDGKFEGNPHTIGAHLYHIAGVEYWWIHRIILGEEADDLVKAEFAAAALDSQAAIELEGHDVGYYLGKLDEVRAYTESACWKLKDEELDVEKVNPHDGSLYSVRWILTHLCDHEAHHRGQVQLIKRILHGG